MSFGVGGPTLNGKAYPLRHIEAIHFGKASLAVGPVLVKSAEKFAGLL